MGRHRRQSLLLLASLGLTACGPHAYGGDDGGVVPPEAVPGAPRPRPGFRVELVAAEPLIRSPVAIDWGPDRTLWVVEMRDYPLGMDNRGQPGGRIVCLRDLDGDGRYDQSTTFLDGLLF